MSLQTGIKMFLITGVIFGYSRFRLTNLACFNLIQSIYHNTIFNVNVILFITRLSIFFIEIPSKIADRKESDIHLILIVLNKVLTDFYWISVFLYIMIYTKVNVKNLENSITKLFRFTDIIQRKAKNNYFISAYLFLIISLHVFSTLNFNSYFGSAHTFALLSYTLFGTHFFLNFLGLFSCVMLQLSNLFEDLMTDSYYTKKSNLVLTKSKGIRRKKLGIRDVTLKNLKVKILYFQDIAEDLIAYFQYPISILFLSYILYLISEITRSATEKEFKHIIIISIISSVMIIFLILYVADILQQKNRGFIVHLKKVSLEENSPRKKKEIKEICVLLERFPQISFFGFFTIGRHCLLPILSSFITYLIIGIQFKLSLPQETGKEIT
ncbi:UNVERIFIED_CONTAM: hypothetical protein RMT77_001705 [Armadillidium vulgare]